MNEQPQAPVSQANEQSVPPVQAPVIPPVGEQSGSSGSLGKYLLIGLGAVLLVAATAGVTYWLLTKDESNSTEGTTEEEETTIDVDEESESEEGQPESEDEVEMFDPYEGWEIYTVTRYSVSFMYPPSWSVTLEEGPASEGPDDYTDVIVTNSDSKSIVRFYVGHYFGAITKPEVASNGETVKVAGETYYKYMCNDLGYLYYDASQGNNFERTGECYELYTESTAQQFAYLPNFESANNTIGWYSLMYGSVDREYDYVPSNGDMATALKVVGSFEGL